MKQEKVLNRFREIVNYKLKDVLPEIFWKDLIRRRPIQEICSNYSIGRCSSLFFFHIFGWMDVSGWSSTPARGPQVGPNVHHGLSLMSQSLSVLHVFGLR
jgi:hypothetical protein